MRLSWLTDIHFNFWKDQVQGMSDLVELVKAEKTDAVLITGDIGESDTVTLFLKRFSQLIGLPIYFVLGNHDFFGGWITPTRQVVAQLGEVETSMMHLRNLKYLTSQKNPIELLPSVGLIGHDGWSDARLGNYTTSKIELNDHALIKDFKSLTKGECQTKLRSLSDESASHIQQMLSIAFEKYPHVILATHVPPFKELCAREGTALDEDWLPHMVCKSLGDVILETMTALPQKKITVYCGHIHNAVTYVPLPNVTVHSGAAEVGTLRVRTIEL